MTTAEAWLVTFLGVSTVFFGLVLAIIAINLFNRLARHITWDGGHGHGAAPAPTPAPATSPVVNVAEPEAAIDPETLAVIAAALEIERRLYLGRMGQRLTLRRTEA